jgi:hypothetical protein
MSENPINLALRFILELVALVAMGYWGWTQHQGVWRWLFALGVPILAAAMWGIFRVPNDPGVPPVQVAGAVRLLLELTFFGVAVALLFAARQNSAAYILAGIVVFHYLISYDRIVWLLSQ